MANNITPILDDLILCLCTQLATDGAPACECCVVFGNEPPPMSNRCDCVCDGGQGSGWVRFVGAQWQQDNVSKCPTGVWNVNIELGVYRCASVEQDCETTLAASTSLINDAASLSRSIFCCDALSGKKFSVGDVEILGPTGGCVGVTLGLTVQVFVL